MGTASRLATTLDYEMLNVRGLKVAAPSTPDRDLTPLDASLFARSVPRFLVRYVRRHQVGAFGHGSSARQCVTLTPYSPEEALSWLALPDPTDPPLHALLLDPSKMSGYSLVGPRWIRLGGGIEFILPMGFPSSAVVVGWEMEVT